MDYTEKISKLLRTSPKVISDLEKKMDAITGKSGVLEKIVDENDSLVSEALKELGLSGNPDAKEVNKLLLSRLEYIDNHIFELLGKPELSNPKEVCGSLCKIVESLTSDRNTGFFIKKEKATEILKTNPPPKILSHFNYSGVDELIEKEGLSSVFAALRFLESKEWMHKFFADSYKDLKANDFEEREVEMIILEEKWIDAAEKFLEKKYHNVSHLKELGIIFVIPLKIDIVGETTRILSLLFHYKNEVPFYSRLFRKFSTDADFASKIQLFPEMVLIYPIRVPTLFHPD